MSCKTIKLIQSCVSSLRELYLHFLSILETNLVTCDSVFRTIQAKERRKTPQRISRLIILKHELTKLRKFFYLYGIFFKKTINHLRHIVSKARQKDRK